MQNPLIFRPIRVLTFGVLGFAVVALALLAVVTVRQRQLVAQVQEQIDRQGAFDSRHVRATRLAITLGKEQTRDPAVREELLRLISELEQLATEADTPRKLQHFRTAVEELTPGTYSLILEHVAILQEADADEEEAALARLNRVHLSMRRELILEVVLAAALVAFLAVVFPLADRRVIRPLEAFGRQLARLGQGDYGPAPLDDVDPLLLPLHRSYNQLANRLQTLEAAHERREESLESAVRSATKALLEQQHSLARSERLAATGELAASLAHELRNPLAGIQMTLDNLRQDLRDPDAVERVDLVANEVERLTRLLNQFLDAARHAPEAPRPIDLGEIVEQIRALTRYQLPPGVHVKTEIEPGLTAMLPADRLRQVLLNLVLNAAAAMGEGPGLIQVAAVGVDDRIQVTVVDEGPGFPPEVLERGARPFFSTRQQGTGLGLAMVRRFVRDVGGELLLANHQPHGARVSLVLPRQVAA